MDTTLILFAGMPGSGKTTLARMVGRALSIPYLAKDRVQRVLRDRQLADASTGDGYYVILDLADEQLMLGVSVILDATFPLDHFRMVASDIAAKNNARLSSIYCYCSDDKVWRRRMEERVSYVPNWKPATWNDVLRMRQYYQSWENNALYVDSLKTPEENFGPIMAHIWTAVRRSYIPNEPPEEDRSVDDNA